MFRKLSMTALYLLGAGIIFLNGFASKNDATSSPTDQVYSNSSGKCAFPIAAVGDLQRTSVWEYMAGRESNDVERKEIIENISEQNPGSVILLGDMVFAGDNIDHWRYFDSLMTPIKKENIPIFPVIGNHEILGK